MCITVKELNETVSEIRSLKALKQETEDAIKTLENKVIDFLMETKECAVTNKDGKDMFRYIGADYKATYSSQSRETVNKTEVRKLLNDEDYQKVSKVSIYSVLRIS